MSDALPTLLVPGLLCTGQLYTHQYSLLWRYGPVMVADPVHDETIAAIAQRILSNAPPQFRLAGLSMGGYIALEIMRVAPQRVLKLALLDTSARPDSAEAGVIRRDLITRAKAGEFAHIPDTTYPNAVHPSRLDDAELKQINRQMAQDVGLDAYVRQQTAIMARHDARPNLTDIQCPTTIIVGKEDKITPIVCAEEMASGIRGATLHVIADCGHMSTLEQPQAVNTALASWLDT
jgi:pimeloyl-ACP methyl ester carboxylesterase